jgi:hypothetical protein
MKHKVLKLILDYEKEERWLNEMSAKGLHFVAYAFPLHVFEEGKPGEYTYRIELLENHPSSAEGQAYIRFIEDAGIECVDTHVTWAYFRKRTADGPFELYSDPTSKTRHYGRLATLYAGLAAINAAYVAYVLMLRDLSPLVSLPSAALTALFARMVWSYWRRSRKLRDTMRVHE